MFFGKIKKYFESLHQTAKKSLEPMFRPLHSFLQKYSDFLGRFWELVNRIPWIGRTLLDIVTHINSFIDSSRFSPFYYVKEYGDYPLKLLWEKKFLRYAYLFLLVIACLGFVYFRSASPYVVYFFITLAAIPIVYFVVLFLMALVIPLLIAIFISLFALVIIFLEGLVRWSVTLFVYLILYISYRIMLTVTKVLEYLVTCIFLVYAAAVGSVKS